MDKGEINLLTEDKLTEEMQAELEEVANNLFAETHHRLPTPSERKHLQAEMLKDLNKALQSRDKALLKAFELLGELLPVKLTKHEWEQVKGELQRASEEKKSANPDVKDFQEYFKISDSSMGLIYKVALDLLREEKPEQASCIFDFLITLNPYVKQYWLAAGLSLKKVQKFENALYCFGIVYTLDDQPVVARAEAIECYLEIGSKEDAQLELDELEKLVKGNAPLEKTWHPEIEKFRNRIKEK